jgi:uncharacterized integral membrane protein
MLRKIVSAVILIPLVILIVAFAVANRQAVTVSFDPFSAAHPAWSATVPLFVLIFVLLILGVLIGGVAAWLKQSKWRGATRRLDGQLRELQGEMDEIRRRFGTGEPPGPPERPPMIIPPPIP